MDENLRQEKITNSKKTSGDGADGPETNEIDQNGGVKNPACRRFFVTLRLIGTVVMLISLVLDYTYIYKQTFTSKSYFVWYLIVLIIRVSTPFVILTRYLKDSGKEGKSTSKLMYFFLSFIFFTGSHRLLSFGNFKREIISGLIIDFILYNMPLIMLLGLNNTTVAFMYLDDDGGLSLSLSSILALAMTFKVLSSIDTLLEMMIFGIKVCLVNNMENQSLTQIAAYDE